MSEPCGLWSWGKDAYVLGHTLPPTGASMETKQCLEAKSIHTLKGISLSEICASEKHCLVLTRQGQMYSWGAGTFGRLGHGDKYEQKIPKQIPLNNSIRTISCGDAHSAAIDFNGRLYTWGCGYFGRLGHGDETHATSPRMLYVAQLISVSAVACGGSHTLFLNGDGKVFSCGFGKYHQLGHGTPFDSMFPSEISYLASKKIISLAAGTSHSIALSSDGSIYAWGSNEFGQTGLGTKKDQPTPKLVPFEERVYQVRCGDVHTAILTPSGKVYTFGCCENGRLGYNTTKDQLTPRLVSDIVETVVELKAGGCHTAALDDKGQLYIWGWNKYMQLGVTHKSILERGSDELDSDSDSGSDSDSDEGDPYGISTPMILERVTGCHMIACGKYVTLAYLTSAKKVLLQYALDGDKDEVANILRRYNKKELNNLQLVATDLDGNTPLHIASRFGYDGVAQELMQYGWSLSSVNATSRTPIHLAALHGRDKCIRMYSTNQSCEILNQQDSNSKTALHLAVEHGHHECAKILVQQGADPNIPDRNGKTPLHHSAILGHLGTLKFLASSKGDVLIKDSNKKSPLDYLGLEDAFTIKEHIGFADVYISFVADDTAFSRNLSKKLSENFLTSCTLNSSPKQDSLSQMQQEKIQIARAVVFIISKSSINQAKNKISLLELEYAKESDIPVFAIWKDYTILDPHLESLVYRNQILDFSDADRYDERVTQLASGIKLLFLQNQSGKKRCKWRLKSGIWT
eukprot:TRINITY_DN5054_c0_g1_i7.p1 TRINITY_DN5054_c0_g1~~TRINITY_DN5054_c0_g1_i7.p1  ORF type:complete len:745 (+),score=126.96 TRINITY_DN5054_c0_g1_i7:37-2271(+)